MSISGIRTEIESDANPDEWLAPSTSEVTGRVRGVVPEGATVRAVLSTLRAGTLVDDEVAQGVIDAAGWYRMRYAHTGDDGDVSLSVVVYDADGALVGQSAPVL